MSTEVLDAYQFDRYSRQIGAYGVEAMSKLIKMKVFVSGLGGVGVEAAKNLALAGPGAITLHDDAIIRARDLGTNFFASESDIGTATRAEVCVKPLGELNRLVRVSVHRGEITDVVVKAHTVVVLSCASRTEALRVNDLCRKHGVAFIFSDVYGCMGFCFVDLGDKFTVRDYNGEQPVRRIVSDLSQESEAVLSIVPEPDGRRHNMEESDHDGWVKLEELKGPLGDKLNGKTFKIKHVQKERTDAKTGKVRKIFNAFALRLDVDTSKLPAYSGGGTMTQVKKPVHMPFRSLKDNLRQPVSPGEYGLMFTDGMKFGRAEQLHMALQGLWEFEALNGRLPTPNEAVDANQVAEFSAAYNASMKEHNGTVAEAHSGNKALVLDELEREIAVRVGVHADCELQPLCAFFGGVVAQEVVKVTGKFAPLNQWLHFDAFEVLPEVVPAKERRTMAVDAGEGKEATDNERFLLPTLSPVVPSAADRMPLDSRYDDLIMMFGRPMQERIANMNTFVVGCGALGCELLKNFAMIGLSTGDARPDSCITVTDNDRIEVSNLSRQFLFREHNVGQAKSTAAASAALSMNPHMRVRALESFVGPNTEDTFDDQFWEGLDFVTNALDNVEARMYVDSRCVFYEKPLLESGTLGTKCNVQVILPHLTQSYADGPKDNDNGDAIPMCTLRNFPSQIEHCIEWARAQFTDLFATAATEASNYIQDPRAWIKAVRSKTVDIEHAGLKASAIAKELGPLEAVLDILRKVQINEETCFADCVRIAYLTFFRSFRDKIDSLTKQYPADATDDSGKPFWSGTKRFPRSASFEKENAMHMLYVISMANLLAVNFGLQPPDVPVPDEHPWRSHKHVGAIIDSLQVPEVIHETVDMSEEAKKDSRDDSSEGKEDTQDEMADTQTEELLATFHGALKELEELAASASGLVVEPADFEKDADWNFHIDFITATSNMRAWNYRLKEATRHEAKMIAGKIIPAIATTTAAVTGLVMIEMLKMAQGKPLEAYKDSSSSLGINGYFCSEPSEPVHEKDGYDPIEMEEVKCKPAGFTKWDKTLVRAGNVTLAEFLTAFKAQVGLNCVSLYHENANMEGSMGHSKFIYEREAWQEKLKKVYEARQGMKLKEIVQEIYGDAAVGEKRQYVSLLASSDNDEGSIFNIPAVVFYFE